MRQDITDEAAFTVWTRMQGGEQLSVDLCRQVITESGSTARADQVYYLVRQWCSEITQTRRLGRR